MVFLAVSAVLALNKRALERLLLARWGFFNVTELNFRAPERISRSIEPTAQQDNHQWEQYCDIRYRTCYGRYGNTNTDRKADGARPASTIMVPHRRRAPAVDFPPSPTSRIHHNSVLDSPVPPVPVHELLKIFSAVNLQSTAADELASKLDLCSPLKFRQWPDTRKKGVAEAPRWIPCPAATPSRAKHSCTVEFKLGVLVWAHHMRVTSKAGKQRAPTREETRCKFGLKSVDQISRWKKVGNSSPCSTNI